MKQTFPAILPHLFPDDVPSDDEWTTLFLLLFVSFYLVFGHLEVVDTGFQQSYLSPRRTNFLLYPEAKSQMKKVVSNFKS